MVDIVTKIIHFTSFRMDLIDSLDVPKQNNMELHALVHYKIMLRVE